MSANVDGGSDLESSCARRVRGKVEWAELVDEHVCDLDRDRLWLVG